MQIPFFILGVFLQWVLEVLGAGGAIWGMSEVWHMRGGTVGSGDAEGSNDTLRLPANIVFCLGFFRMFIRYSPQSNFKDAVVSPQDWFSNRGGGSDSDGVMLFLEIFGLVLGIFLQWTLEVLGAGGACWGMSEVWNLRNDLPNPAETNHNFRWVANTVFTVAAFRMMQKYCPDHAVHEAMLSPQVWIRGMQKKVEAAQSRDVQGDLEMTAIGGVGGSVQAGSRQPIAM